MIEVDIRAKRYGPTPVLGQVGFKVAKGETVALVGPSGIGKTAVLRIVAGIDNDFEGNVKRPKAQSVVFQEPTLLPWRNALDNLLLVHSGLEREAALTALDSVGLSAKADQFPGQLSLGQQRRLSLARALAGPAELLILDEPFTSLDSRTVEIMLSLTETMIARRKPATLLVTHDLTEADRLADRILSLQAGHAGAVLV